MIALNAALRSLLLLGQCYHNVSPVPAPGRLAMVEDWGRVLLEGEHNRQADFATLRALQGRGSRGAGPAG
jgi:hypothetical protein